MDSSRIGEITASPLPHQSEPPGRDPKPPSSHRPNQRSQCSQRKSVVAYLQDLGPIDEKKAKEAMALEKATDLNPHP